MITKLHKAQETWVAKAILGLTALSFVSLFGVAGYVNTAAQNPSVIKVGDVSLSHAELNFQVDQEIALAKKLFGEGFEVSGEIRNTIVSDMVQNNLSKMITAAEAQKHNIYISDDLVRKIIFSQIQFFDANGNFDKAKFGRFLSASNMSEKAYVDAVKNDLLKQFLLQNPVAGIKVAKISKDLLNKAESQRKVFKYIAMDASDMKVERKMSEEEVSQIFEDFAEEFTVPESRDVSVLSFSIDEIAGKAAVSNEEVEAYYAENIEQFSAPETRSVLQMIFENEEAANKALAELNSGKDFYAISKDMAKQTNEETNLEFVSKDMLLTDLGDAVFEAPKGGIVGPVSSEYGWHIMKVEDVKPASKMEDAKAKTMIVDSLRKEKAYDTAYSFVSSVEDKIGAGTDLTEIASEMNAKIVSINGITEDGKSTPLVDTDLLANTNFIDAVFSYNKGEVSRAVETNDGFVFVKVDAVRDAHLQDKQSAQAKLNEFWVASEKRAVLQDLLNDISHDIETGDSIDDVAKRYSLKLVKTDPMSRTEYVSWLNKAQMYDLFNEEIGAPRVFSSADKSIVAVAAENATPKTLSEQELQVLERRTQVDNNSLAVDRLLNSYSKDFKVRVKDRLIGLDE